MAQNNISTPGFYSLAFCHTKQDYQEIENKENKIRKNGEKEKKNESCNKVRVKESS